MKVVLFTIDEANRLVTEIRPQIERLVESKREFDRLQTRIAVLGLTADGAAPGNPDVAELRRMHDQRNVLADQISQVVSGIHRRGAMIKDLERGLVDFHALAGDRLVCLCWQLGEPVISHWHTLEGGFSARQPLKHSELD